VIVCEGFVFFVSAVCNNNCHSVYFKDEEEVEAEDEDDEGEEDLQGEEGTLNTWFFNIYRDISMGIW